MQCSESLGFSVPASILLGGRGLRCAGTRPCVEHASGDKATGLAALLCLELLGFTPELCSKFWPADAAASGKAYLTRDSHG